MHQPDHFHQHPESAIFQAIQMKVRLPQNGTILLHAVQANVLWKPE